MAASSTASTAVPFVLIPLCAIHSRTMRPDTRYPIDELSTTSISTLPTFFPARSLPAAVPA